jgi:hypothetical protein
MTFRIAFAALTAGAALAGASLAIAAPAYHTPKTEFGDPDLQGVWTNASVTTLERPPGVKDLVLTPDQAAKLLAQYKAMLSDNDKPAQDERGDPGGYNSFWLDPGSQLGVVNGQIRSSWVVDPPDGHIPYSPAAIADLRRMFMRGDFSRADNPETRSLGERCIVGYGSTGGPPMLNVLYNNNYQIVQSPGYVVIMVEMNHEALVIRLGGAHLPATFRPWMGDSVGHWEGDTLVVETTNLNPGEQFTADVRHRLYLAPDSKVTERFTRIAGDQILYEFKVEEPQAYTQSWRGEIPMHATKGPIYEYACHEGNYALPDILAGARQQEAEAAAKAAAPKPVASR